MTRVMTASTMIFALGIDAPGTDLDLWKYAFTQGGLLIVVLVLLWSYRRDLKALSERQDEKIKVLTDLVSANTAAMTSSAAASVANEKAAHRLSRALDRFEERSQPRH